MDEFNLQALLAEIDRRQAELIAANRQLSAISATAQSRDGLVEVVVSAAGVVKTVRLAPEIFRRSSPQYLAGSLVAAIQQAARTVAPSRKRATAPGAEIRREFSDLAEAIPKPSPATLIPAARSDTSRAEVGGDGTSNDRTVRAEVNSMGIVTVIDISPSVFRGGAVTRLETAIVEATQRAARALFESRSDALDPDLRESETAPQAPDLDALYPVPAAVEPPASPTHTFTPEPPRPLPAPANPTGHVIPGTRKPNRDALYTPHDLDDEDGYYQHHRQNGWLV
ncbi:YbaB/EbfC family nucleoid-associated protein [Nocardia sp. NPDC046473]|uniref:YbaB/EbfC family nucleoid-associated protein n=1 Tax=Nocardia sp. NPDC046473 TaxID=3155733 RepID=UPI0033C8CF5E